MSVCCDIHCVVAIGTLIERLWRICLALRASFFLSVCVIVGASRQFLSVCACASRISGASRRSGAWVWSYPKLGHFCRLAVNTAVWVYVHVELMIRPFFGAPGTTIPFRRDDDVCGSAHVYHSPSARLHNRASVGSRTPIAVPACHSGCIGGIASERHCSLC